MTTQEAADYLNMSPFTVRRLIKDGRLTATRFGSAANAPWMITRASIEAYRERNEGKAKRDPTRN